MTNIEKITKEVKKHHTASKNEEKELANIRIQFFDAATEILEAQPRATRIILIPDLNGVATDEAIASWVSTYHQGWIILKIEDDPLRVLVEEDPAWMKFSYVSADGKTIFQRGITEGSPDLDDESLRTADPDLWLRVTRSQEEELLEQFADELAEEPEDAIHGNVDRFIRKHRDEFLRVLRPFDTLSAEDFASVQKYIVPGKLKYTLLAPRKPKAEELE